MYKEIRANVASYPQMTVHAIVVTFNGSWKNVARLVSQLENDGIEYIVVDNGSTNFDGADSINILPLGDNFGIAHAQNVGIEYCRGLGAQIVVFFDQDSSVDSGFVNALVQPLLTGRAKITAPVFFDIQAGFGYPIVAISKHGIRSKHFVEDMSGEFRTNVVISSGSTVLVDVFDVAGIMNADLFIDYVDTEWCLRCAQAGFDVLIDPRIRMGHSIGDLSFKVWKFRIPVHSPLRRYYRIRNSFLLLRMSHVPKIMALREVVFSLIHQALLIIMGRGQRWNYLKFLCIGVAHGVINRRGRF